MPLTPQELKDKLLRTLDKDYNVVDMAGAREALSILENYPITRETLEQTRLGRYVNEMRKKTVDREFAKRIKNLVRRWQVLVTPGAPAAVAAEQVSDAPTRVSDTPTRVSDPPTRVSEPPTRVSDPPARVNGKAPTNARLPDGHFHLKGLPTALRPTSPASRPETPCSIRSGVSSPRSTHGATTATPANRKDGIDARESSAVATSLARCASEVPLSRSAVASPLVGHTAVASQHRVQNAKLHSAPTTPMNSSNLGGGLSTLTAISSANNVVTSKKRKREEELSGAQPGIKLKIMKKSSTVESEMVLKDRIPSTTAADTWSCTSETVARKPPVVNGMLASLPDSSTPPSSGSASVPPNNPLVKSSRVGRPPNSTNRKAVTLDRASSLVSTTPVASVGRAESATVTRPETPASSSLPTFVPKVATTAELIQTLHARGDLRLTASETVRKIASNQIVKETMSENDSVVPAAAKPRPRKKNSVAMPPSTPDMMTMVQIKNERIHKFLESSVPPVSPGNNSLMSLLKRLDPPPDPDAPLFNDYSTSKLSHSRSASPGPIRTTDPVALDAPWDSLPPVDPDQIDWSTTEYVAPDPHDRPPVTDDDVERLHTSQWSGVNGQYDFRNDWSDWTKTFSVSSYDGDLLHILPYVNIQD